MDILDPPNWGGPNEERGLSPSAPHEQHSNLMKHQTLLKFVSLAFALAVSSGCAALNQLGSLSLKQSLDGEINQVGSMRSKIEAGIKEITNSLDLLERNMLAFQGVRPPVGEFDFKILRETITSLDGMTLGVLVSNATPVKASYSAAISHLGGETRQQLEKVRVEGQRLWKSIKMDIPAAISNLGSVAKDSALELATIKVKADELLPLAEKNPLMTDADRQTLKSDHSRLLVEIDQLKGLADDVVRQSTGYGTRLSAAAVKLEKHLKSF